MIELLNLNMKYEHLGMFTCMKMAMWTESISLRTMILHIIIKQSGVSNAEEEWNPIELAIIIWDSNCLKW